MSDLFWLSPDQVHRIEPYFPLPHGVPRVDDRRVVSGIIHVIRNGLRWPHDGNSAVPVSEIYHKWSGQPTPRRERLRCHDGRWGDLFKDAQDAVSGMVDLLTKRHGIDAVDAYMLCSVCGDLRISEIVDQPNWIVSFYFPRMVFE